MAEVKENEELIKVGSGTDSNKVAGCINGIYSKDPTTKIILRVIGAGALNQAIKGAISSNRNFSKQGKKVSLFPYFRDLDNGMTAIELLVEVK